MSNEKTFNINLKKIDEILDRGISVGYKQGVESANSNFCLFSRYLVEFNGDLKEACISYLAHLGYTVTTAYDGMNVIGIVDNENE